MITIKVKPISKSEYSEATGFNMINKDLHYYEMEMILSDCGVSCETSYRTSFTEIKTKEEVLKHIQNNTSDFGKTLGRLLGEMYIKKGLVEIRFV